jgi:hypothetical protein
MEGYLKGLWKLALELGLMLALKTVANAKLKKEQEFHCCRKLSIL